MQTRYRRAGSWLVRALAGLLGLAAVCALAVPASAQTAPGSACVPSSPPPAQPGPGGWLPGPGAAGDNTLVGFVDGPAVGQTLSAGNPMEVRGWVVDTSAQGWAGVDQVQVLSGPMEQCAPLLASIPFALPRPDVASAFDNAYWAASGFDGPSVPNSLPQGSATLYVYAHTPGKGWWYKPVSVTIGPPGPRYTDDPIVVIEQPTHGLSVPTYRSYTATGYALDRNAVGLTNTGVDRVSVYLGPREQHAPYLGDATLGLLDPAAHALYGDQFADAGWSLQFEPTRFPEHDYNLYVYAHSSVTGKESVTLIQFHINEVAAPL